MSLLEHSKTTPSKSRSPLPPFNCENANIANYSCKNCNFQTQLTLLFKQHVEHNHNTKKDNQINKSNEFIIHNYICEKCKFETHFSMKWLQHFEECLEGEKNTQVTNNHDQCESLLKRYLLAENINDVEIIREKSSNRTKHNFSVPYRTTKKSKRFECNQCPFKTKYNYSLKLHINCFHLDDQDAQWYQCSACPYKTKHSSCINRHIDALHLDEAEIKWYKCEKCQFKTKRSNYLKTHINALHLDEAEVKWHRCKGCTYKTKHKSHLNSHLRMRH
ncbi:hypothetical protein Zmor_018752 [Zophobas morio]|uniref:Protein hunchback n=1 Tax=Zophobas morio TaxID=2755281 RepID=A0AA38ICZ6_9CUCU|nr:hypothetical protein Zmor_018752 [Zophobas morio]